MYVSIDIGGTNTRIASSRSLIDLVIKDRFEFKNTHNFEQDFSKIENQISLIVDKIEGIGIGIPGYVNEDQGVVLFTTWNQEYENKDILSKLHKKFNCPVYLNNDATVAALGEAYYGRGRNADFVYVTWGTGIGGALVKCAKSELIATKLSWEKFFQQWEEKCGGRKIEKRFNKQAVELSIEEWNEVMSNFREQLTAFVGKIQPTKTVVFGGGISTKQQRRIKQLKVFFKDVDLNISKLGENNGIYGGFGLLRGKID